MLVLVTRPRTYDSKPTEHLATHVGEEALTLKSAPMSESSVKAQATQRARRNSSILKTQQRRASLATSKRLGLLSGTGRVWLQYVTANPGRPPDVLSGRRAAR